MTERDLANVDELKSYLADGPFASDLVTPLLGGGGNYTFRLHLNQPYRNQKTVVLKHGKPYIPGMKSFAIDIIRQKYDVHAMRDVKSWFPDSFVTTPEIFLFDEDDSVIIMEDCGEDSLNLKQQLLQNVLSLPAARVIGTALGRFLAQLHSKGSSEEKILEFYDGNKQARVISAFATYDRVVDTLNGDPTAPSLLDPPLGVSKEDLDIVSEVTKETSRAIQTTRETLVMGDFWPGNLIPVLEREGEELRVKRVYVVDWELTKPGLRGQDIGQLCAELYQARTFHPECQGQAQEILSSFLEAYSKETRENLVEIARIAMVHVGAHLVAWTPRTPWGGKEKTREVVWQGVRHLVDGSKGNKDEIERSVIGALIAKHS